MEEKEKSGENPWKIERYDATRREVWDAFVRSSRQGTFLHERGYMEYHADRFEDYSLMAYKRGKLLAILPANIVLSTPDGEESGALLQSHGGLTYGGWLTPSLHFDGTDMMALFECWIEYCREVGISEIDYKPVPHIYSVHPAEEDIYLLFRHGASMSECNLSESVDLTSPIHLNTLRRRVLRKAERLTPAFSIREIEADDTQGTSEFHHLLSRCLDTRYEAQPVHTLEELLHLRHQFPQNIRIHAIYREGEMQAAVCVYHTRTVAHCQYIASTLQGREENLLTPLFVHLMQDVYKESRWWDFGTSNEDHGRYLNEGLLRQKASFGAGGTAYTRWRIRI